MCVRVLLPIKKQLWLTTHSSLPDRWIENSLFSQGFMGMAEKSPPKYFFFYKNGNLSYFCSIESIINYLSVLLRWKPGWTDVFVTKPNIDCQEIVFNHTGLSEMLWCNDFRAEGQKVLSEEQINQECLIVIFGWYHATIIAELNCGIGLSSAGQQVERLIIWYLVSIWSSGEYLVLWNLAHYTQETWHAFFTEY